MQARPKFTARAWGGPLTFWRWPVSDRILYNQREAAEKLSVSERQIADWRRAGLLKAKKPGRENLFLHSVLVEFAESMPDSEAS